MKEATTYTIEPVNTFRGLRLAELMKNRGLGDVDLADMMGVTASAVGHWRNGRVGIHVGNELSLAYIFDVHRGVFYENEEPTLPVVGVSNHISIQAFCARREDMLRKSDFINGHFGVSRDREEQWLASNGVDTRLVRKIIHREGFTPLGPEPIKAPIPAPDVSAAPVPTTELASPDDIKKLLARIERYRERNQLTWNLTEKGRLTAMRVKTEVFE